MDHMVLFPTTSHTHTQENGANVQVLFKYQKGTLRRLLRKMTGNPPKLWNREKIRSLHFLGLPPKSNQAYGRKVSCGNHDLFYVCVVCRGKFPGFMTHIILSKVQREALNLSRAKSNHMEMTGALKKRPSICHCREKTHRIKT